MMLSAIYVKPGFLTKTMIISQTQAYKSLPESEDPYIQFNCCEDAVIVLILKYALLDYS